MSIERWFAGIPLDDEVRHGLVAHLDTGLAGAALPGRPVRPANWHLTLRFLGDVHEVSRELFLGALDEALPGPAFTMGFERLGAFPRPARATVLWLGVVAGGERLNEWAEVCEEAARRAGLDAEERPFRPHVTLSRIRPPEDVSELVQESTPLPHRQIVSGVTLFRSKQGPDGTRYEEVASVPARA